MPGPWQPFSNWQSVPSLPPKIIGRRAAEDLDAFTVAVGRHAVRYSSASKVRALDASLARTAMLRLSTFILQENIMMHCSIDLCIGQLSNIPVLRFSVILYLTQE
jgi:hypothetical protein